MFVWILGTFINFILSALVTFAFSLVFNGGEFLTPMFWIMFGVIMVIEVVGEMMRSAARDARYRTYSMNALRRYQSKSKPSEAMSAGPGPDMTARKANASTLSQLAEEGFKV